MNTSISIVRQNEGRDWFSEFSPELWYDSVVPMVVCNLSVYGSERNGSWRQENQLGVPRPPSLYIAAGKT